MREQETHEIPAGTVVPPGRYQRIDDGSLRIVTLTQDGVLPASFDGRVAVYHRLETADLAVAPTFVRSLVAAGAYPSRRSFGA